ncbi:unnamed protein product [Phytophthora fragariaefolia]|uniref:Unnamed protein product n=1 Tax=Phytophthora fragariaefolia TaxID=1490495 RepID=A0A9W6TZ83_9STRA|nr:unnamed protein product [Phytophthora fragariaefolia]
MVRRNAEHQRITTQHMSTDEMVADVMTKALGVVKFRAAMKVLPQLGDTNQADEFSAAAPAAAAVRRN